MATAAALVQKATTDQLFGPDWAMNLKICDIVFHDPRQAKNVVKVIRKRLGNKNPKVQLLILTLLETLMKNCRVVVHRPIEEQNILQKMVKIVKKKAGGGREFTSQMIEQLVLRCLRGHL
ncbi:hypothetical protein O6H91_Y049600 [Diphasiastrum complanatum]|nr:hypothetical protein O6H91_Y049600 [Diphasiastrum complanatum]